MHKTMDRFIKSHAGPVLGFVSEGRSYGDLCKVQISGRESQAFERIDIKFVGERKINPQKVSVHEKFIVIPAREGEGFYVLKLSVPAETKNNYSATFEESVKSFMPEK